MCPWTLKSEIEMYTDHKNNTYKWKIGRNLAEIQIYLKIWNLYTENISIKDAEQCTLPIEIKYIFCKKCTKYMHGT